MPNILKAGETVLSNETVCLADLRKQDIPEENFKADVKSNEMADEKEEAAKDEEAQKIRAGELRSQIIEAEKELNRIRTETEGLRQRAHEDAENIKKEAYEQGYLEGSSAKQKEIEQCINEVGSVIAELCEQNKQYVTEYEKALKWFAVEIATKILSKKIEEDETEMTELVKQAVGTVKNADWISVQISQEMPKLLDTLAKELVEPREANQLRTEVSMKDIPKGSCIVETTEGLLDASISAQIENLKEFFRQAEE